MIKQLTIVGLLATLSTPVYAGEFSIIKPIAGYHFSDRNHPKGYEWNENYLASLGVAYRRDSGLGASVTYVDENSVGESSFYIHGEFVPLVWSKDSYSLALGGALGVRNGYAHKASNRTKSDFIVSGALQGEICKDSICSMLQVVPYTSGVAVWSLKYKF